MFSRLKNFSLLFLCIVAYPFRGKVKTVPANPKTIVIFRQKAHMGDVVCITPMFRAIKKKYPNAKVIFIGSGRVDKVIDHNPDVDEFIRYDKNFWTILRKLRKEKVDFACMANLGSSLGFTLLYLAGAKCISLFQSSKIPVYSWSYSLVRKWAIEKPFVSGAYFPPQYLELLEPLGVDTSDVSFRLHFSDESARNVDEVLSERGVTDVDFVVALGLGGSTEERWWPAERFARIGEWLHHEYGAKLCIIGAGKDEKAFQNFLRHLDPNVTYLNLLNQPFDEFKVLISKCDLVIGNDSGPMVTADAFDVAQVIFVGPTDERENHPPIGPTRRILKHPSENVGDISLEWAQSELRIVLNYLGIENILNQTAIHTPISPAELLDKIAILEIKRERIVEREKLRNIQHELETLRDIFEKHIRVSKELETLFDKLRELSRKGWEIEDGKRACERENDFGDKFIEFARAAFKNNDERSSVWKQINLLLKSEIVQEKSYEKY